MMLNIRTSLESQSTGLGWPIYYLYPACLLLQPWAAVSQPVCKGKHQLLLIWKVSSYCCLPLQGSAGVDKNYRWTRSPRLMYLSDGNKTQCRNNCAENIGKSHSFLLSVTGDCKLSLHSGWLISVPVIGWLEMPWCCRESSGSLPCVDACPTRYAGYLAT